MSRSASRSERSHAARGKAETSGMLGRKSKRGGGAAAAGAARRAAPSTPAGDARPRALAQAQVALGGELGVGIDGDAPRDAELAGQVARRRNLRAGAQGALADGAAELVLDLRAQRRGRLAAHGEQELYGLTGLVQRPKSGSGICTSRP